MQFKALVAYQARGFLAQRERADDLQAELAMANQKQLASKYAQTTGLLRQTGPLHTASRPTAVR